MKSITELNEYLRKIESDHQHQDFPGSPRTLQGSNPHIHAVLISHEFTDHCNEHTLRELDINTPIFATSAAVKVIRAWDYFEKVCEISTCSDQNLDWREFSPELPPWLGIARIVSSNFDVGYLHSALMICFESESTSPKTETPVEAIIYTPHGISPDNLSLLSCASPQIQPLALIHGLHEVFVCRLGQINLGAVNGLAVMTRLGARYWLTTHDEIKKGKGLISYLLGCNELTLGEAADRAKGNCIGSGLAPDPNRFHFAELGSGESLLLE